MISRFQRALRICRREQGSAMVEMAVSASILFAMLFGICETCYGLYVYQYVSDAARQATRYAMVRGATCISNTPTQTNCPAGGITTDEVTAFVETLNYPGVKMSNVHVTTTWCQASTSRPTSTNPTTWSSCSATTAETPGNLVRVVVSYDLSLHIPWSDNYSGANHLSPTGISEMVIAQ